MRDMFKKLRNRFLLSNLLLTSLVLLGAFAVLYSLVYWDVRQETEKRLLALPESVRINGAASIPTAGNVAHYVTDLAAGERHLGSTVFFRITVTAEGEVSRNDPHYQHMEEAYLNIARSAWKHRDIHRVFSMGMTRWQSVIVPSPDIPGEYDIYFMDVYSARALLSKLLRTFLAIVPLVLLSVFLISRKAAQNSVRPIAEAWERQRQFVADASHELKTPLAVISANADALLLESQDSPGSSRKWLGYIRDEISRMSGLINDLLLLAKVEGNAHTESRMQFDLGQCIAEACVVVEAMLYEKGIALESSIPEHVILDSSEDNVRKLISILLDNAVKYTNPGGFIRVCLKKQKGIAELSIENSGPGIPAQMLPYIFDRFYRADQARENEDGSYGLGLSIAKGISGRLGAELTAQSVPGRSTTFTFRIRTGC